MRRCVLAFGFLLLFAAGSCGFIWIMEVCEEAAVSRRLYEERAVLQAQFIERQSKLIELQERVSLVSSRLVLRLMEPLGLDKGNSVGATVIEALGYVKPGGIGGGSDEDAAAQLAGSGHGRKPKSRGLRGTR